VWHGGLLELSPDQTHTLRCASRERRGDYRIATQTFYQAAYAELASTMRSEALFPVATKGFYAFRDPSTRTQSVVLGFSPWSIRFVHNDTFTTPSAYFPTYTRLPFDAWFIAELARRTASRKHDRYSAGFTLSNRLLKLIRLFYSLRPDSIVRFCCWLRVCISCKDLIRLRLATLSGWNWFHVCLSLENLIAVCVLCIKERAAGFYYIPLALISCF